VSVGYATSAQGTAELQGKVSIVTGAAKGIGRATAQAFAEAGAAVCLVDVDEEAGSRAAEALRQAGAQAIFMAADVSHSAAVDRSVQRCLEQFGGVDILVNNAARAIPGTVDVLSEQDWNASLAINLTGAFLFSRRVLPTMTERGGGVIINVASITGLVGRAGRPAYCASKGGLIALSRAMAVDHAPDGVRVIAVCPSGIETDQMAELFRESPDPEAARAESVALHLAGRLAAPKELADFLTYLASDRASFITGSVLTFDGGYTAV
jgi:NAD(P)-dependent dehydrogenase (short-subunit alcohol dehydrogenase family)